MVSCRRSEECKKWKAKSSGLFRQLVCQDWDHCKYNINFLQRPLLHITKDRNFISPKTTTTYHQKDNHYISARMTTTYHQRPPLHITKKTTTTYQQGWPLHITKDHHNTSSKTTATYHQRPPLQIIELWSLINRQSFRGAVNDARSAEQSVMKRWSLVICSGGLWWYVAVVSYCMWS